MAAAVAVFVSFASVAAQERTAPPRLVELGRARAHGDGTAVRCLLRPDSAHMLTVGAEGDLVWWDLRERRPLRWHAPQGPPLRDVLLHPGEPWAVCRLDDGTAIRVDLERGTRTPWAPAAEVHWITGGHPAREGAVSANGAHRIENGRRASGRQSRSFGTCWLADDGTVVEARWTSVRIEGLDVRDRAETGVHAAAPQQLVFTPDGSHLALLGLHAMQVVDVAGNDVARLAGPHVAVPGPAASELWLLTESTLQRWDAARREPVGGSVRWPWRDLRLVETADVVPRLRPLLVRGGQPWTPTAFRRPDGSFRDLVFEPPPSPAPARPGPEQYAFLGRPETARAFVVSPAANVPLLLTSVVGEGKFTRSQATLRRIGNDGATTHHVRFDDAAQWLVADDDGRAIVGLASATVHSFAIADLAVGATATFSPPLRAAIALGGSRLLATNGTRLLWLDAATLVELAEVALPNGLQGVDQLARNADGSRVALAHGSDVRILRVE